MWGKLSSYPNSVENNTPNKLKSLKKEVVKGLGAKYEYKQWVPYAVWTTRYQTSTTINEPAIALMTRLVKQHNENIKESTEGKGHALNSKYWHSLEFIKNFSSLQQLKKGSKIKFSSQIVDKGVISILSDYINKKDAMAATEMLIIIKVSWKAAEAKVFNIQNPWMWKAVPYKIPETFLDNFF